MLAKSIFFNRQRIIGIILAILFLVASIFIGNRFGANERVTPQQTSENITSVVAQRLHQISKPVHITANGILIAKSKIDVVSRVSGIFEGSDRTFKAGVCFNKGEVLAALDNADFYANLKMARAQLLQSLTVILPDLKFDYPEAYLKWQSYVDQFDTNRATPDLPAVNSSREKAFINSKNILTQYYTIKAQEVTNTYYRIMAPFDGILTESLVNPGSLIGAGQKLGTFIDPRKYELEIKLSPVDANKVKGGQQVELSSVSTGEKWHGMIKRINEVTDLGSQSLLAIVEVSGAGLSEGLYLQAHVQTVRLENVVEIDRNLLIDNKYIYTINDSILNKVEVELLHIGEIYAYIRGLKDGQLVLGKALPGAYDGMKVNPI